MPSGVSISKRTMWLEVLLFLITISPFVYLAFNLKKDLAPFSGAIYVYFFTATIFYFFSVWFTLLDSRKENFKELFVTIFQIRLIWAFFVAGIGWLFFIHLVANYPIDFLRMIGVFLSLFLFASGNFQGKIHQSSAFAGSSWQNSKFMKLQRNHLRLKFWIGLLATYIFLTFQASFLGIGYAFVAVAIVYGIIFRIILGFLK